MQRQALPEGALEVGVFWAFSGELIAMIICRPTHRVAFLRQAVEKHTGGGLCRLLLEGRFLRDEETMLAVGGGKGFVVRVVRCSQPEPSLREFFEVWYYALMLGFVGSSSDDELDEDIRVDESDSECELDLDTGTQEAERTGRPFARIGVYHDRPEGASNLGSELILQDDFKDPAVCVELCVGARVFLTENRWADAGLRNGALGVVREFLWPRGGHPPSLDLRLRAPLCVFVEFCDVDMGIDPATGQRRSFFPDHDQKRHWVPIWRNNSHSHSEEGVSCEQFPLRLARASTHWKVAGRTLIPERLSVREKIAAVPGIGYVAVTRVPDVTWLLRA